MGLITGLLTLPLAPVRGTIWVAEQLAAEAEREEKRGSQSVLRRKHPFPWAGSGLIVLSH